MSIIHVERIEKRIRDDFQKLLEKDKSITPSEFLSRGQAALALMSQVQIPAKEAAKCITDGYQDNGIDAIYIDKDTKNLYLIQSKWSSKGNNVPDKADIIKFLLGVEDIVNIRFERFNEKIRARKNQIIEALRDTDFRIQMILVHTATNRLSSEVETVIKQKIDSLNDTSELFFFSVLDQKHLYKCILMGSEGSAIDLANISIYNWGKHEGLYEGIYGQIEAGTLADWWNHYGATLLAKNIRKFKGSTSVNAMIRITLTNSPEDFWYFNNGITVLCKAISKSPIHGNEKSVGVFSFHGVSIVNGAQTFGTIGEAYRNHKNEVSRAKVQIRFINLEKAPSEYANKITRFTNTQNRIETKDFAALDQNQSRLREELWLDGITYAFKAGEPTPISDKGCDLEEATIALACAHNDIHLSILANRELGTIWQDIEKGPYRAIFNDMTQSFKLWNCVKVYRIVEELLKLKTNDFNETDAQLAIHGNRFLLHQLYKKIGRGLMSKPKLDISSLNINDEFDLIFDAAKSALKKAYPNAILYTLFKNQSKVERLSTLIDQKFGLEKNLFSDLPVVE